jgi:hypothetical protein
MLVLMTEEVIDYQTYTIQMYRRFMKRLIG